MISVFLDLKKAFYTVNHEILSKTLFAYGVRGNILNWFRNYLDHRKQFVFLDNKKSQTKVITCGVSPRLSTRSTPIHNVYQCEIRAFESAVADSQWLGPIHFDKMSL